MKKVELSRLGDFVKIKTGKLDANASTIDGAYPFFTCSETPLRIASYSYDCECILVAGNGDLNVKYYQGKFDAYQRTYIIESIDKKRLNVRFLYYFMESYMDKLRALSIGGVIKYIKLNYLTDAQIFIPPLDEQIYIAQVLDQADHLRQQDRQLLTHYDQLVQAVFVDMFGDPVRNEKGWPIKNLGEVVSRIQIGPFGSLLHAEDYVEGGIPLINPMHIADLKIHPGQGYSITPTKLKELSNYKLKAGDVIMGRRGEMGRCALVGNEETGWLCGTGSLFLSPSEKMQSLYLTYLLSRNSIKKLLEEKAQGATMANLNATILNNLKVPVPPAETQQRFATAIAQIEAQKAATQQLQTQSEALFNSLLQQAFRGELKQLEPATTPTAGQLALALE